MSDLIADQEQFMQDAGSFLTRMADAGQTELPQYDILAQAVSGMNSEPIGGHNWLSEQGLAQSQMNQVTDINAQNAGRQLSDPEYAAACPDCSPGEPCCLRALKVEDADDSGRFVEWPVDEGAPKRLYVIAKDPYGGRPSAKAKVTLTDFEPCQLNYALPKAQMIGSADHDGSGIMGEGEITVTTPFQLPAFTSSLLPREAMVVIYICGLLVQMKTYRDTYPTQVNPSQSMIPTARGVEIIALPHVSVNASITGSLSASLSLTAAPTLGAGCQVDIGGEVGNQSVAFSSSVGITSRPRSPGAQQGPVYHPLFDFLDKIQTSMSAISDHTVHNPYPRVVSQGGRALELRFGLSVSVGITNVSLAPKSGSPNLELVVNPFNLTINPSITGTVDLLGLLLRYVPNGNTIRGILAREGNAFRANAYFEITISGNGTGDFRVLRAATVEIGDVDSLEADLSNIGLQYTASLELAATIEAKLEVELDTWIITAYAGAGVSARTGWNFGGRATEQNGTTKWEKMFGFQGLIVEGYAEAGLGRREVVTTSDPLAGSDPLNPIETVVETSDGTSVRQNTNRGEFRAVILEPAGDKETWYEV